MCILKINPIKALQFGFEAGRDEVNVQGQTASKPLPSCIFTPV